MNFSFHMVAIMSTTVFNTIRSGVMTAGFSTGPIIASTRQTGIASSFVLNNLQQSITSGVFSSRYPHYGYPRNPIPSRLPFYLSTNNAEEKATLKKARLVFLGTPDVAATSLRTLVEYSKQGDRYA